MMQRQEPSCPLQPSCLLLSLPQLPFQAVLKRLRSKDRQSLAGASRGLAKAITAASQHTRLTVTPATGWEGLRKILAWKTITWKALSLKGEVNSEHKAASTNSALGVLLGCNNTTPEALFRGLKHAILCVHPLPCLIPSNLAHTAPDLEYLEFDYKGVYDSHLQPLSYCTSLRSLSVFCVSDDPLRLPSKYDTPQDLREYLPNINSLHLSSYESSAAHDEAFAGCVDVMLRAWRDQLTELCLSQGSKMNSCIGLLDVHLQHCTRLKYLDAWQSNRLVASLPSLPPTLTHLELLQSILDPQDIEMLLPLQVVKLRSCSRVLQRDWSGHPCAWRQLTIVDLSIAELPKLPLQSLNGEQPLSISFLRLPHPLHSNSIAEVSSAVQCVSNAGLTITGFSGWNCAMWGIRSVDTLCDAALAELLRLASTVVQPPGYYQFFANQVSHYPQTVTGLITWLSSTLFELAFYSCMVELQHWFWQALQCCSKLATVSMKFDNEDKPCMDSICDVVLSAAQYLVGVIRRPLAMYLYLKACKESEREDFKINMEVALQEKLPNCVKLQDCSWQLHDRLHISLGPSACPER